jgi:acyl-CoA synthetase (AMP-forming)/AMP-acid ligase II
VLLTHPAVPAVAIIPNPEWGEEVKAIVELKSGCAPSAELELIEHCRAWLAHYRCPRSVDFVTKLLRYDSGKLSKYALRESYRRGCARVSKARAPASNRSIATSPASTALDHGRRAQGRLGNLEQVSGERRE